MGRDRSAGSAEQDHIGAPTPYDIDTARCPPADGDLSFYRKRFPYYTDLIAGIAKVAGAEPDRLALENRAAQDKTACMDLAFYGPDGPINAFSKERSRTSFKGLGYLKVIPAGRLSLSHLHECRDQFGRPVYIQCDAERRPTHSRRRLQAALDEWKHSGSM